MRQGLIEKTYEWDLTADPATLWPLLSDTARMNEALNLPRYRISETFDSNSIRRRHGEIFEDEDRVRWEEPLFEWVDKGWWRWRRFYDDGPFKETGGVLMLMPAKGGGTHMHYTLSADPNGAMGRMLVASGHLKLAARSFQKFTREVDAFCKRPFGDFYSNLSFKRSKQKSPTLPEAMDDEAKILTQFAEWLAVAPFADRIDLRSKRLSRCLGITQSEALRACLTAVTSGDLVMRFRAICPNCRASAIEFPTLTKIPALLACRRCGGGYHRDLSGGTELLFSVAQTDGLDGTFCGSGPSAAPHVAVQQVLGAVERRDLDHRLNAGVYVARAIDGPVSEPFEVTSPSGFHITLTSTGIETASTQGGTTIENHCKREYVVTLERTEWPEDALPLAEAVTEQAFHDLIPKQGLPDGDSASLGQGAILAIADFGKSFPTASGAVLCESGDGYGAFAFSSLMKAVTAAESLRKAHPEARFALDSGPLTIATVDGRIRFIGTVPDTAETLSLSGHRGVIVISPRMKDALAAQGIPAPAAVLKAS